MVKGSITHRTFEYILEELASMSHLQREIFGGLKLKVPEFPEHDEFNKIGIKKKTFDFNKTPETTSSLDMRYFFMAKWTKLKNRPFEKKD